MVMGRAWHRASYRRRDNIKQSQDTCHQVDSRIRADSTRWTRLRLRVDRSCVKEGDLKQTIVSTVLSTLAPLTPAKPNR